MIYDMYLDIIYIYIYTVYCVYIYIYVYYTVHDFMCKQEKPTNPNAVT